MLLGDHNLYTLMPSQKFFLVDDLYIHPDFNVPSPLSNDLALAFLPQEMAFNSKYVKMRRRTRWKRSEEEEEEEEEEVVCFQAFCWFDCITFQ